MLALAAERTSRIGIGPGVLVPSLRHPMTNAAGIAMIAALAPGRLSVAIGSGFTGRMTLGQRPLSWKFVRTYVLALQALLRGEAVEWEGALIQMMQPEGFGAARPIEVPIILGIGGPPRAMAAAGHGAAVALHALYERGGDFSRIPGGPGWVAELEEVPEERRHIALHHLHLIGFTERDAKVVDGSMLRQFGGVRTAAEWRERLAQLEAAGVTEIAYQPAGPDIPGELERFMAP
ncbi:MAG TPA: LLM class flavin-dependent oxidoreductase [Tepidiformaceae bacterium]|nr:LLM class flavin-dependent oxidoreductase [Tepidiformaceae bacterium]